MADYYESASDSPSPNERKFGNDLTTHSTWVPDQWADEFRTALEANLVLAKIVKNIPFNDKVKGDVIREMSLI